MNFDLYFFRFMKILINKIKISAMGFLNREKRHIFLIAHLRALKTPPYSTTPSPIPIYI